MTSKEKLIKVRELLIEIDNLIDQDLIDETDEIIETIPFEYLACGSLEHLARDTDFWASDLHEIINKM